MDILVIGTGNIGTLYGWALAEAGHNVTHMVRSGATRPPMATLDVLDERGGKAVRRSGEYAWRIAEEPPAQAQLVLVATPATQVRDAVLPLAARYPEATFLTWAMEWDPVPLPSEVAARVLLGYPDSGGTRTPDCRYILSLGEEPHLGRRMVNGSLTGDKSRLDDVVALFSAAGFTPAIHEPFEPWLWVHAANTVPYWLALAEHRDMRRFVRDRGLLRDAFRASREVLAIVSARDVDLDDYDEAGTALHTPVWLFPFAFHLLYRTNEGMRRAAAHGVAGIDEGLDLANQIVRSAEELDVPMPTFRTLQHRSVAAA